MLVGSPSVRRGVHRSAAMTVKGEAFDGRRPDESGQSLRGHVAKGISYDTVWVFAWAADQASVSCAGAVGAKHPAARARGTGTISDRGRTAGPRKESPSPGLTAPADRPCAVLWAPSMDERSLTDYETVLNTLISGTIYHTAPGKCCTLPGCRI